MKFRYLRWMIKTALLYLLVGMALGVCFFLAYRYPAFEWALRFRSAHAHLLFVGVVFQIIMGVALWMFPRQAEEPHVTPEPQGMRLYVLLNVGVLLRTACEPFWEQSEGLYHAALIGMLFQWMATAYFVWLIVRRVRGITFEPRKGGVG